MMIGERIRFVKVGGKGRLYRDDIMYEGEVVAIVHIGESARALVAKHFPDQRLGVSNTDCATKYERYLVRLDSGRWALCPVPRAYAMAKPQTGTPNAPERKYLRRPGL